MWLAGCFMIASSLLCGSYTGYQHNKMRAGRLTASATSSTNFLGSVVGFQRSRKLRMETCCNCKSGNSSIIVLGCSSRSSSSKFDVLRYGRLSRVRASVSDKSCNLEPKTTVAGVTSLITLFDMVNKAYAVDVSANTTTAVADVVEKKSDWLTPLSDSLEALLKVMDSTLEAVHVPYSYGFAIILLTLFVKLITFPLTKSSVESTLSMQKIQPRVAELKAKYPNDQEKLQLETARLYQSAGINPLAGCVPTLATIPIFIGLYRGLTQAADDGLLVDGFFFIPSLAGPTSIAMRQSGAGLQWLVPFQDGAPPVGWHDAGCYLAMPALIVLSQYVSQAVLAAGSPQAQEQQNNPVFKFLPVMLGYFSLNVPSGLTLYWLTNNILSTAQQVYLRSSVGSATTETPSNKEKPGSTIDLLENGENGFEIANYEAMGKQNDKKIPPPPSAVMGEFPGVDDSENGSSTTRKMMNSNGKPMSKAQKKRVMKQTRRSK